MVLTELVELGGAPTIDGDVDREELPVFEGLAVGETVELGFIEIVAPPWIASLEIYSVCVAVLL